MRHLFNVGEPSAGRLVSLHNLAWLADLVGRARRAVLEGTFSELAAEVGRTWGRGPARGGAGGTARLIALSLVEGPAFWAQVVIAGWAPPSYAAHK